MPKDAAAFEKRYGLRLISTYGLTDYGLGCIRNLNAPASKMHSAGIPRLRRRDRAAYNPRF